MPSKERMGAADVPKWWLDKAIPLLNASEESQLSIAKRASAYAGRRNPWDGSAITKFKKGEGRTVDLTNALSCALGIVRPFYTAPTESAAKIIAEVVRDALEHVDGKNIKLTVADRAVGAEIHNAIVDGGRTRGVPSRDDGAPRGDGIRVGSRDGRPRRRRP